MNFNFTQEIQHIEFIEGDELRQEFFYVKSETRTENLTAEEYEKQALSRAYGWEPIGDIKNKTFKYVTEKGEIVFCGYCEKNKTLYLEKK